MKKLSRLLTLLLVVCSIAVIFSACNSNDHDKITADYAKLKNVDKAEIDFTCYAEFDGTHVLMLNWDYPDALSEEIVHGVVFRHNQIKTFDVYNKGEFYSLQEAFNNGLLTHNNLVTLRDRYNPTVQGADDAEYSLTVYDPSGYIIEPLQEAYRAGENVTVKTDVFFDIDLIVYLDGVSVGSPRSVFENDEYHWEFYFVMPSHNATLTFTSSGGM